MSGVIPEGYKRGRKDLVSDNPKVTPRVHIVARDPIDMLPFDSPERMELRQHARSEQAEKFITSEYEKPEEERFAEKPRFKLLSLDPLSTFEYALASTAGKAAFGSEFSATEGFMEKTQLTDVYGRAEKETLAKIKAGEISGVTYESYKAAREQAIQSGWAVEDMAPSPFVSSLLFDPLAHTSAQRGGLGGAGVYINGKYEYLTENGGKVLSSMLGRESIKNSQKVIFMFGRMVQDNPKLFADLIEKRGLRIAFTNFELVPRQFLPHVVAGKAIGMAKQSVVSTWDSMTTAFNRQYSSILAKFPKKPIPNIPIEFNEIRALSKLELADAQKRIHDQVKELMEDAKKQMGDKFDINLLTEYAENPSIREKLKHLDPIFQRWEAIRKNIATIEKAHGVLRHERDNYIRHYLTTAAKKAKGIVVGVKGYATKVQFDIARIYDGSIAAENYRSMVQDGYKLFDDRFGKIIERRMNEHEAIMNTLDLMRKVNQQFGKTAKEVAGNKDYVQSFRDPNIYIPKDIAWALQKEEQVKSVLSLVGYKTKYEKAKDIALLAPRAAWTFQKWTLHTWEKLQTRGFPAFYAVNYYGGKFMSYLGGGVDIADDVAAVHVMLKKDPGKVLIKSELDPRIQYTAQDLQELSFKYKLTSVDPLGVESGKLEKSTGFAKLGWVMEEELRTSLFYNRLRKGDTPEEAYKYVIKYQFDYTNEMKGADAVLQHVIPFYRWQKNAIPFFASQTIEAYGKMRAFGVMAQATWNSPEADVIKPYIPDWAETRVNVFMGGQRNEVLSFNLPMGTVPETLRKFTSFGNATQFFGPAITIPYQISEGRETFTGEEIKDPWKFPLKVMAGRHIAAVNKIVGGAPAWEVGLELGPGINVMQGNDLMYYAGAYNMASERITNEALRRMGGRWRGCGV